MSLAKAAGTTDAIDRRSSPLEMTPAQFREIGHRLIDDVAKQLERLPQGLVTRRCPTRGPKRRG